MLVLCPTSGLAQTDKEIKTSVNELVHKYYMDGIPYATAHALGPAALPYLFELLGNPKEKPFWVNIIVTIGFIEDSSAVDPLINMLEETQGDVDPENFRALLSVPYALGCIAANGDDTAFEYLVSKLDTPLNQTWPWNFRDKPIAELIAEQSVMALAVSGRPEARRLLKDLQAKAAQKSGQEALRIITGNIDQGLDIMDRIEAKGRAAVLNPQREN